MLNNIISYSSYSHPQIEEQITNLKTELLGHTTIKVPALIVPKSNARHLNIDRLLRETFATRFITH